MATSLDVVTLKAALGWSWTNSLTFGQTANASALAATLKLLNGTAANCVNVLPEPVTYALAGSGTQNIDLAGSLLDFAGKTITMTRVVAMLIRLTNATAASSILVGNGTNPFINWITGTGPAIRIRNNGFMLLAAPDATGYPVTAGTGDILKLANEDASLVANVSVAIAGVGTTA